MNNFTGIAFKDLKIVTSPGGLLCFFEKGADFAFDIKRIYYIYRFTKDNRRGFHAHKELKQVFFCPHGAIKIEFDNGEKRQEYVLDKPEKILIVTEGYWREFVSLQEGSILCVGASDVYNEADYIRNYDDYLSYLCVKDNA